MYRQRYRGLTLIEVLAATVLLSLVLVGVVLARGRALSQWSTSNRLLEAVDVTDAWLMQQWQDLETFPRDEQGVIEGDTEFRWRTETITNPAVEDLGGVCVRLEILDTQSDPEEAALLGIDLVLPDLTIEEDAHESVVGVNP